MFNYYKKFNNNTNELIKIIHNYIDSYYKIHNDEYLDEIELLEFLRDVHGDKIKCCDIKFVLIYLKLELIHYIEITPIFK